MKALFCCMLRGKQSFVLRPNYAFKPTPEQALRSIWPYGRRGLMRR